MIDRKLASIRSIDLFAGCTEDELRRIASTADMLNLRAGEVLRTEIDDAPCFYVVLSGAVAVGEDGVLVAGGWHGAIGLLGGQLEMDELRMLSDGKVLVAGPREFGGLVATVPGFATAIGRELTRRLREQHRRNFAA